MSRVALKSIKFYESMSEETFCFQADIFFDGKKIAYCKNSGHGSCTDINKYENVSRETFKEFNDYCNSLPSEIYNGTELKSDSETVINNLLESWLKQKDLIKFEIAMSKDFAKGICFGTKEKYQIMRWRNHTIESLVRHPQGIAVLKKCIIELENRGETILNTNLPKEVLN